MRAAPSCGIMIVGPVADWKRRGAATPFRPGSNPGPGLQFPSQACAAPTVSAITAPRAPSGFAAPGRVARGLVLDLGIEFGADEDDRGREPHPHHQADHRAERAVGRVVVGEVRQVPGERGRDREPAKRGEHAADADPAPFRVRAATGRSDRAPRGRASRARTATGQRSSGSQSGLPFAANPTKASTSGSTTTAPIASSDQHDGAEREGQRDQR